MHIEVWADLTCPWCFLGKRRLERALGMWRQEGGAPVQVVRRPYQVDPGAPREGEPRDPQRAQRFMALHSADRLETYLGELSQGEGPGFRWQPSWRVGTFDAHRLIALALEQGGPALQEAVEEELLRAHFLLGQNLGDPQVLSAAAGRGGFAGAARALHSGAGGAQVRAQLVRGIASGIQAAPTLVVGRHALAGAQEPEAILAFLRRAAREQPDPAETSALPVPVPVPVDVPLDGAVGGAMACAAGAAPAGDEAQPDLVETLRSAERLLEERDPLEALRTLRPLMEQYGDDTTVRLLAARCYFASAQLKRAESELLSLVAANPDDDYARFVLGRCLERQSRRQEAATHFRVAAAMDPSPERLRAVARTAG